MTTPHDTRVYEAESVLRTLDYGIGFNTLADTQRYVDTIQGDYHVLQNYPALGKIPIVLKKSVRYEWAGAHIDTGIVMCPVWSMNNLVMTHEVSHFAAFPEEMKEIDHGAMFCGAHIYIVGRFVSKEASRSLKYAYKAYGVDYEY